MRLHHQPIHRYFIHLPRLSCLLKTIVQESNPGTGARDRSFMHMQWKKEQASRCCTADLCLHHSVNQLSNQKMAKLVLFSTNSCLRHVKVIEPFMSLTLPILFVHTRVVGISVESYGQFQVQFSSMVFAFPYPNKFTIEWRRATTATL